MTSSRSASPGVAGRIAGYLEEIGLLILVVLALPAAILLIGAPFTLLFKAIALITRSQ
jgi:hypothetical protein